MARSDDIDTPADRTDAALMAAHADGDPDAFGELFRRWARRLFAFLYHMTGDRELAEDLMQETFLRAHRARGQFDPERAFRPWIFRIAANAQRDVTRSWFWKLKRRTVSLFDPEGRGGAVAERVAGPAARRPDRIAEAADEADRLRRALAGIPAMQRQALVLHDVEGLTAREVAELYGRPLPTVLSWLRRGRLALRSRLAGEGGSRGDG